GGDRTHNKSNTLHIIVKPLTVETRWGSPKGSPVRRVSRIRRTRTFHHALRCLPKTARRCRTERPRGYTRNVTAHYSGTGTGNTGGQGQLAPVADPLRGHRRPPRLHRDG